jgi:hypothetical protein
VVIAKLVGGECRDQSQAFGSTLAWLSRANFRRMACALRTRPPNCSVYCELPLHRQPTSNASIPETSRNRQDAYSQGRPQGDPRVSPPLHHSALRRNRVGDIHTKYPILSLSFIWPLHSRFCMNSANNCSPGTSSEVSIPPCTRAMAMAQVNNFAALLHIRIG